jgi:glycosyltransferase involved in cell wall biosynthesis
MSMDVLPLVTVYIPTHNRCDLLKRAVESVFKQDYSNIELIIVDDASVDGTNEFLNKLKREHSNVITFRQAEAKGACAARNIAIEAAQGQFITGLDDDDEFLPHRISHFIDNYNEDYAFVCTGFLWHYGQKARAVDNTVKIISLKEQLNYNYATNQVFVNTERLKSINGFDEAFVACQDYDTWTRLIKTFGDAQRISGTSYIIHRGDDIERLTKPDNWLKGHRQFIEKHGSLFSKANIKNQEFKRMMAKRKAFTLIALLQQLNAGLFKEKLRYFVSSNFTLLSKLRRNFLENRR